MLGLVGESVMTDLSFLWTS